MAKDDSVYVGHMVDMALVLALTHLLQVIGEAAGRVGNDFASRHPEIPWRAIIGMRHRLVHDYLSVDRDVVWAVVTSDLEPLIAKLTTLSSAPSASCQPHLLQLPIQRLPLNPQDPRRPALVPVRRRHHAPDLLGLGIRQRFA